MSKLLVAILMFTFFSGSLGYLYLVPSYSMTLTIPEGPKILSGHERMIIDANVACRSYMKSYSKDGYIKISLKTHNFSHGLDCINYVSTRISCESTFKFPYAECNSVGAQSVELAVAKISGALDIRQIEKNNQLRYILFYIIGLLLLFSVIYSNRGQKIISRS